MTFAPIKRQTVAVQVAEALRQAIIDGRFVPGDPLPSERDLAGQFGINRSSIREALLRLEAWGLITIRQGEATRVRDVYEVGGLQMLPHLLMPNGVVDVELLGDVLAIRVMFLRWTAREAARTARRTPEAIAELGATVQALEQAEAPHEVLRLDWSFFEQVVRLAGNRVVAICTHWLREIYLENPEPLLLLYPSLPFDTTDHRRALQAIAAGEVQAAGEAMERYGRRALGGGDVPQAQ